MSGKQSNLPPPKARRRREGGKARRADSGVSIWNNICFVVDFRNLLFGRDFDLSFSKGYSLMKFFNL
jgi:hypothetical protein